LQIKSIQASAEFRKAEIKIDRVFLNSNTLTRISAIC